MSIEDNQIFLSGIESYDAPREETLINVNFCATFGRRIDFYEETDRERTSVCMTAISAQQQWQHSMPLAANLLLVIDTGGRNAIVCDLFRGNIMNFVIPGLTWNPDQTNYDLL